MKYLSYLFLLLILLSCESKINEQTSNGVEIDDLVAIGDEQFKIKYEVSELEQKIIDAGLVDVEVVIPGIFVDLKYSTTDNFFGKDVYGDLTRCYVQPEVAEMLLLAVRMRGPSTLPALTASRIAAVKSPLCSFRRSLNR